MSKAQEPEAGVAAVVDERQVEAFPETVPPPPPPAPAPVKVKRPAKLAVRQAPQPDFAAELRRVAQEFRALCERHRVTQGSLTWTGAAVQVSVQRREELEV